MPASAGKIAVPLGSMLDIFIEQAALMRMDLGAEDVQGALDAADAPPQDSQ